MAALVRPGQVEHLVYERVAHQRVLHLERAEREILDAALPLLRYLGLKPVVVTDSVHQALTAVTREELTTPVGTKFTVAVSPERFEDTPEGCRQLLQAIAAKHPNSLLLILPAPLADGQWVDLVQSHRFDTRLIVVH